MNNQTLYHRPGLVRFDAMPRSALRFLLAVAAFSLGLRGLGYLFAANFHAITSSHDWSYHAFWLPLHLLLARYASVVFSRNVSTSIDNAAESERTEIADSIGLIVSYKGMLAALLLVTPFIVLDGYAAIDYVRENYVLQRNAAVLIPLIWLVEWVATAQIWLYVLGSILVNSKVLKESCIAGRHVDVLMNGHLRAPLQCGLENGFIILVYGLSTIGYVWYANGQLSDYLVLLISTLMVMACFMVALAQLKAGLRKSLNAELDIFKRRFTPPPAVMQANGVNASLPVAYADFKEAVTMLFEKRISKENKVEDRIRLIKLAIASQLPASRNMISQEVYIEGLLLIECEIRLSQFGIGEIKTLSFRAGMPLIAILGKSIAGVVGVH